jgi:hypothetical protein
VNGQAASQTQSTMMPDGTLVIEDTRGAARMSMVRPGVLLYVCSGYFGEAFYSPMVAPAQEEISRRGALVLLVDGWDLKSVDSGYREAWTEWFKVHKQDFRMTLLVRTKLMEMAASLANLFTGAHVVSTHSTIGAWERAAARDVTGFRRTPAPATSSS